MYLASDFFIDEVVFALVGEDDVDFFGSRSANVRAKHDVVRRVAVHTGLVEIRGKYFDVTTTTIDVLLVFYCA